MLLADKLKKLPHEIRNMPFSDFQKMIAFYELQNEAAEKHQKQQQAAPKPKKAAKGRRRGR